MKVALLGDIEIERQFFVDNIATANNVTFISDVLCQTSSKVINAGRIIASQNDVYMFGAIGKDADGDIVLQDLAKYKINSSHVELLADKSTGQVIVMTDKSGKSAISVYLGASNLIKPLSQNSNFKYLYTATSVELSCLYESLETCNNESIINFVDVPNQHKEFDFNYLKYIDYFIPNRHEAGLLLETKISSVKEAKEVATFFYSKGCKNVVITLDKDGCVFIGGSYRKPEHLKSQKIEVIDETGSGDIFRGVFANNIIRNEDILSAVQKAISTSRFSVTCKGVSNSIEKSIEFNNNENSN